MEGIYDFDMHENSPDVGKEYQPKKEDVTIKIDYDNHSAVPF